MYNLILQDHIKFIWLVAALLPADANAFSHN